MDIAKIAKQACTELGFSVEQGSEANSIAFRIIYDALTRVAEQRDAPVRAEQKCPTCDGLGMRKYGDERGLWHCYDCNGTGISNRSAGG